MENEPKLPTVAFWGQEEGLQPLEAWKNQFTPEWHKRADVSKMI